MARSVGSGHGNPCPFPYFLLQSRSVQFPVVARVAMPILVFVPAERAVVVWQPLPMSSARVLLSPSGGMGCHMFSSLGPVRRAMVGMATQAHFLLQGPFNGQVAWQPVPVFFFGACDEQLSYLVFFSGLVWWHGLPCPFFIHVGSIRFSSERGSRSRTAVPSRQCLWEIVLSCRGIEASLKPGRRKPRGGKASSRKECLECSCVVVGALWYQ